ncbi:hypothetical protein N7478_004950 [Penicillium angulare]|uniref:uncharacterized protein n=1 Tax=Penicillium angulare TaxID=116970 RepID=UPI0025414409|nr:uncharacterized protein N7478_004950 [Penicillium angulare]KAJ5279578.1 hypothetical protein N7478_004950 [Penicillium angulare]
MTSNIPEIYLLCMDINFITAFNSALETIWPNHSPAKIKITPINERLNNIPPFTKYDVIVSPANSYGRLDGAFDHAISMTFSPHDDYHALTRATQLVLYDKWRGYAPPGSCTLVEFPEALKQNSRGCEWVAICPTMREPQNVNWDREIVFECVWSLLNQVEGHNRRLTSGSKNASEGKRIESLLLPPLAVGVGKVSKKRWAQQAVLAMMHFVEAVEKPENWSCLNWDKIEVIGDEINDTWKEK